jgi:uncharacterized membrane protein
MEVPKIILFSCLVLFNIISILFKLFPPKKINSLYGYRTNSSMKSESTWRIANRYFSNLLLLLNLVLSISVLLFYSFNIKIEFVLLLELLGFVFALLIGIIMTEVKIKRVNNE